MPGASPVVPHTIRTQAAGTKHWNGTVLQPWHSLPVLVEDLEGLGG